MVVNAVIIIILFVSCMCYFIKEEYYDNFQSFLLSFMCCCFFTFLSVLYTFCVSIAEPATVVVNEEIQSIAQFVDYNHQDTKIYLVQNGKEEEYRIKIVNELGLEETFIISADYLHITRTDDEEPSLKIITTDYASKFLRVTTLLSQNKEYFVTIPNSSTSIYHWSDQIFI